MPNIPSIETLTNQNVRQQLADGGFARSNQFQVSITNGWGTQGGSTPFMINQDLQIDKELYDKFPVVLILLYRIVHQNFSDKL